MNHNFNTPQTITLFLKHIQLNRNLHKPLSYQNFQQQLNSIKRKKYLVLLLLFLVPVFYRFARKSYEKTQFYKNRRKRHESFAHHLAKAESQSASKVASLSDSTKVQVDAVFYQKLSFLLGIIIPSWKSKEAGLLLMHSFFLILRTWLSVVVARLDGIIVKDLVNGNAREFLKGLGYWFAIAIPATYTNSMIRFLQSKLALAFRSRLTDHIHKEYMHDMIYYKIINLDSRIGSSADQLICTDLAKFCDACASLYSNMAKPVLDTVIFNYQLYQSIGGMGMTALFVNYLITARLLRAVTPGFGKLAAVEAKLEGDFRSVHTRLITNAEEIAFYNGETRELSILNLTYDTLMRHVNRIYRIRIFYNMFEDFIIKYAWSAVGLLVCSVPVFYPNIAGKAGKRDFKSVEIYEEDTPGVPLTSSEPPNSPNITKTQTSARTQGFITNKRLMMSLADAGGRIMYSYKELAELAGYTSRVYDLLSVFEDMKIRKYTRTMVNQQSTETTGRNTNKITQKSLDEVFHSAENLQRLEMEEMAIREYSLNDIRGIVRAGYNGVKVTSVPVVTPSGDSLVRDLTFEIKSGMHLLIAGPNGVGKTSIMRIIAGLWPAFRGVIDRPTDGKIIYIPQRPYLSMGTLRDQIIYPDTHQDMKSKGISDEKLIEILEIVHLDYLPAREGGWEVVKEWKDVFSGGEKQRMNLARLFYHRPEFAILDECTSAVSSDVEGLMYSRAKDWGITLLTISHKPSLMKHHKYLLRLESEGGRWEISDLSPHLAKRNVDAEIKELQEQIKEEEGMRRRLKEINDLLGVKMNAIKK